MADSKSDEVELARIYGELGCVLFEEMERLGPSSPNEVAEWDNLTDWKRGLYINSVERLLDERERINRVFQLTDYHPILRSSEKGE